MSSTATPMVNTSQRVGIFVDVQNMFYSAKILYQSKVDYGELLKGLLGGRPLIRAVAYVVQKPEVDQAGFHEALSRFGYEVRVKELRIREDGEGRSSAKGSWAVGMACDALMIAPRIDVAILVTGNGDYVSLVENLRFLGVRVEVASFERSAANELIKAADKHVIIQQSWIFKEKKFVEAAAAHDAAAHEGLPHDEEESDVEAQPSSNDSAPVFKK